MPATAPSFFEGMRVISMDGRDMFGRRVDEHGALCAADPWLGLMLASTPMDEILRLRAEAISRHGPLWVKRPVEN